ncbi:pseudouridylate synthase 7 homolog [Lingula anatina]|uniref:Pseudouridylate synthase 7 homolog n=1 Tax=Lingula anatina TaxID=7574 RepID=A0A1S3JCV9_LINAN|nr:pseudouridylate synthase 7 homolog [Lingula anatina]|eukprot:XP_013408250.1 pseudouridylate synthase 7 homolog [Lingula anatina]
MADIPQHTAESQVQEDNLEPLAKKQKLEEGTDPVVVKEKEITGSEDGSLLTEKDCGITEYLSSHQGFTGVLKQRFSDFIVHEIDTDGNVVHLTDLSLPLEKEECPDPGLDLCPFFSAEDIAKLEEFVTREDKAATLTLPVQEDKEMRTQMYKTLKKKYPNLDGRTVKSEIGASVIEVSFKKGESRSSQVWPQSRGKHLKFVLYKENKDTMQAISQISRFLRIKPNMFCYAGTKDKRAVTTQYISCFKVDAKRIQELNQHTDTLAMGNFRYVDHPVTLGQLKGNHFTIVLRDVLGTDDQINAGWTAVRETGLINYFGMQRFGTTIVPTHHIGRALLHCDYKEALELIMKPRHKPGERSWDKPEQCRQKWSETRDAGQALAVIGRFNCVEQYVMTGLKKHQGKNFKAAIQMIPKNSRTLYMHSYQSYIWNQIVSRRIRQFGMKPMAGDLVLDSDTVDGADCDVDDLDAVKEQSQKSGDTASQPSVTVLTEETAANYTIYDVVIPLPGYGVTYPENEVKQWISDLLKKDGIDADTFKQSLKSFSVSGSYRKMLVRPEGVKWSIHRYDDNTIPLVLTDRDRLNNVELPTQSEEGKLKAIKVEFSLPKGCYATMVVREALKMETSQSFQISLNR